MAKAKKDDKVGISDPRGLKRICMECGVRFFDMNARPITCPSCAVEFTGEVKVKAKRGRAASVAEVTESEAPKKKDVKANKVEDDDDEDDIEEEDDGTEIVSLEDLETPSKGDDDEIKVDLDSDDDDDDDLNVDDDSIGGLDELEPDADD